MSAPLKVHSQAFYNAHQRDETSGLQFVLINSTVRDWAHWWARTLPPRNYIWIDKPDLKSAIGAVIAECKKYQMKLKTIYLVGHGSILGQEFGNETITPQGALTVLRGIEMGARSVHKPAPPPARPIRHHGTSQQSVEPVAIIRELLPYYLRDGSGEFIMAGCRVGAGSTAVAVSRALPNIVVSAYDMAQLPGTCSNAGTQYFYKNGGSKGSIFHYTPGTLLSTFETTGQILGEAHPQQDSE